MWQPTYKVSAKKILPAFKICEGLATFALSSMAPNSRLPEGKQLFSINHIVCTNSLDTVSHPYQYLGTPSTSQGPSLTSRTSQRKATASLLCSLLSHMPKTDMMITRWRGTNFLRDTDLRTMKSFRQLILSEVLRHHGKQS